MGYTTVFDGSFAVTPPLKPEHAAYLRLFSRTRRMQRDAAVTEKRDDPTRAAVGLPVGEQGAYFVGEGGLAGQGEGPRTVGIVDYNNPPGGQPGLWCQWTPNEDGTAIEWDQCEKFYYSVEWLQYLVDHFLAPWGYALNGSVTWQGEEPGDMGRIVATSNLITTQKGRVVYE